MLVYSGLLCAMAALIISLFFPLQYRADAEVFILSKSRYGVDPYTVVRSAERIGENLVQIMSTNDFFEKVISEPNTGIDTSRFEGVNERVKRKRWQKAVNARVVFGTGALHISGYHRDSDEAEALAGAVARTLSTRGTEYVGGDVTIRVVNAPVSTRFPARPNLVINTILGLVIGLLGMSIWILRKRV